MEKPAAACYHLPGLFEFYELYRRFLPLYREHRKYFYDWCTIGSIYGAPAGCIWGGGRISCGGAAAHEVLALLREYGISGRLTFSNSLLRAEHLADPQCNALCDQFAKSGSVPNGVIVHSDLLADYLRQRWPELYLVSSTTKVLTEFAELRQELEKPQFRYVVPDFRLNPALEQLRTLPPEQKAKAYNVQMMSAAPSASAATRRSAARIWARTARTTAAPPRMPPGATAFPRRCAAPGLLGWRTSGSGICPQVFPSSR